MIAWQNPAAFIALTALAGPVVIHLLRRGRADAGAMALVAASTGGVAVNAGDLTPLEEHLRGLAAAPEPATIRPLRSVWCVALFAACLCAEWAERRRRGLE